MGCGWGEGGGGRGWRVAGSRGCGWEWGRRHPTSHGACGRGRQRRCIARQEHSNRAAAYAENCPRPRRTPGCRKVSLNARRTVSLLRLRRGREGRSRTGTTGVPSGTPRCGRGRPEQDCSELQAHMRASASTWRRRRRRTPGPPGLQLWAPPAHPLGLGHRPLHLGHRAHAQLPAGRGHALGAGKSAGLDLGRHPANPGRCASRMSRVLGPPGVLPLLGRAGGAGGCALGPADAPTNPAETKDSASASRGAPALRFARG